MAIATLGGGCFWCLEATLGRLVGVAEVVCGYSGGASQNPTYEQVCSGASGHIEVARVDFDAALLSYQDLLLAFFTIHDPTTHDRQGRDVGSQYRSVIFTHDAQQQDIARRLIAELDAAAIWKQPIVTKISPAPTFWPAEAHHQNYYATHSGQPYCQVVISPKIAKLQARFALQP